LQAELISYSATQLHAALFSQRKVLSEIGQVCGEIKKTFIFVWNRSGWAASKFLLAGVRTVGLPTNR